MAPQNTNTEASRELAGLYRGTHRAAQSTISDPAPSGVSKQTWQLVGTVLDKLARDFARQRDANVCTAVWYERIRLTRALAMIAATRILKSQRPDDLDVNKSARRAAHWMLLAADFLATSIEELAQRFPRPVVNANNFAARLAAHAPYLLGITEEQAAQFADELVAANLIAP